MGFHVDYSALDQLYTGIYTNATAWQESLTSVNGSVQTLIETTNMSGVGADNLRNYFSVLHGSIIPSLATLVSAHVGNCLLYVRAYQSGIDTGLHAIIDEDELQDIKQNFIIDRNTSEDIDYSVQSAIDGISDIFYTGCSGHSTIEDIYGEIDRLIDGLLTDVNALEDSHSQSDFAETTPLISALTAFINEHLANAYSYKTSFNPASITESATFAELAGAYVTVNEANAAKQAALAEAISDENARIEALQAEYEAQVAEMEARQKAVEKQKWAVVGLCILGSIAVVATAGTATPLLLATTSAASGLIISGVDEAGNQYVQHGEVTDWGKVGGKAFIGGATGFITGYVGGTIGQTATKLMQATAVGQTLLGSSSTLIRVGTNAFIGSTSEIISGIGSRAVGSFAGTMIVTGGDLQESLGTAWESALDKEQIAYDAALGGFFGGMEGLHDAPKEAVESGEQFKADGKSLKENVTYKSGEYDYEYSTNNRGWIEDAHADEIHFTDRTERLPHKANTVGKQSGDHAGHLFGDQYGGSPDLDNLVSQNGHVNQSDFGKIEKHWNSSLKNNKAVTDVDIHVDYGAFSSGRPKSFTVSYYVDGEHFSKVIKNIK